MLSSMYSYPTFLVFLAAVLAAVITMILMPFLIRFLKRAEIGQQVREEGMESQ